MHLEITKKSFNLKRVLIASAILALFLGVLVYLNFVLNVFGFFCESPGGCRDRNLRHTDIPRYKEDTNYFVSDTGEFRCSKPIKLVSYTLDKEGTATKFSPVDPDEAKLFCHLTFAIEYKGKIKILQRPDVLALVSKYQYKDVSIKALEFQYIQDKDFVDRLLPTYKNREIGCIIVLETPNEKKVYLEDEKLETFEELDFQKFQQYLDLASEADRQLLITNLK